MDKNQLLELLYQCYLEARKHKRHTHSQMLFESHLEDNIVKLCNDIYAKKYKISPSIYFIQYDPVQREIFAWNFRDRIVHHLIFELISPYREKQFIYDSYSCRKGKGTSFGVQRIYKFMQAISNDFTQDAWILKMDIKWYFMSINKDILWQKIHNFISERSNFQWKWDSQIFPWGKFIISDKYPDYIIKIIHDTIYNDPTKSGIFKWKRSDYIGLPPTKSLFTSKKWCGLPIWNLTSQLFSNIYLNDFDHYVKEKLNIKYYGRYVDDFVLMHTDKEYLKSCIPIIRDYLSDTVHLTLHPNKIYLQPVDRGVHFLWASIYPYCIYRGKRTIHNFKNKLKETNNYPSRESLDSFIWLMMHYNNYKLIRKFLHQIGEDNVRDISKFASKFLE